MERTLIIGPASHHFPKCTLTNQTSRLAQMNEWLRGLPPAEKIQQPGEKA